MRQNPNQEEKMIDGKSYKKYSEIVKQWKIIGLWAFDAVPRHISDIHLASGAYNPNVSDRRRKVLALARSGRKHGGFGRGTSVYHEVARLEHVQCRCNNPNCDLQ
jgi:hypothetical protein